MTTTLAEQMKQFQDNPSPGLKKTYTDRPPQRSGRGFNRCDLCDLHKHAQHVKIDRRGSEDPSVMIIGEAPGRDEDKIGMPFVGKSGKLLDAMLIEAGYPHEMKGRFPQFPDVMITNAVRCVPWNNPQNKREGVRAPTDEEWTSCSPYLFQDIYHYDPDVIVVMGGSSMEKVLGWEGSVTAGREQTDWELEVGDKKFPVIATFHPAFVLRSVSRARADVVRDLRKAYELASGKKIIKGFNPQLFLINDTDQAIALVDKMLALHEADMLPYKCISFDVETTSFDPKKVAFDPYNEDLDLTGISFAFSDDAGYYIPLHHRESEIDIPRLYEAFKRLFEVVDTTAHQSKFDTSWVWTKVGVKPRQTHCTLMMSNIAYGETRAHGLKELGVDLLGNSDYERELAYLTEIKSKDYGDLPLSIMADYGAMDAVVGHALMGPLMEELEKHDLWETYERSMNVTREFTNIEYRGAFVDEEYRQRLRQEYTDGRKEAFAAIRANPVVQRFEEFAGKDFNPNSSDMMTSVFYYERSGKPQHLHDQLGMICKRGSREAKNFPDDNSYDEMPYGFEVYRKGILTDVKYTEFYGYCLDIHGFTGTGAASAAENEMFLLFQQSEKELCRMTGIDEGEAGTTIKLMELAGAGREMMELCWNGGTRYEVSEDSLINAEKMEEPTYSLGFRLRYWVEVLELLLNIRRYKKLGKLISSYLDSMTEYFRNDERCREQLKHNKLMVQNYRYLVEGTRTGRVSTQEFSLHTVPWGCWTADTKIKLLDGRSLRMDELVKEYEGKEFWVYSIDEDHNIVPGRARNPHITRRNAELVELTFDNGAKARCTPDHLMRLRDGTYKAAKDLIPDDGLAALYTKDDGKGYEMFWNPSDNKFKWTHRVSCDYWRPGFSVSAMVRHHVNFDKRDNRPENLIPMPHGTHTRIHGIINPYSHIQLIEKYGSLSNAKKATYENNPDLIARQSKKQTENWQDPAYREMQYKARPMGERSRLVYGHPEKGERNRQRQLEVVGSPEYKKFKSAEAVERNLNDAIAMVNLLEETGYEVNEENWILFRDEGFFEHVVSNPKRVMHMETAFKYLESQPQNHRITSVRYLEEKEDVYDFEVLEHHNFAIDLGDESGVFVHNSDITRLFTSEWWDIGGLIMAMDFSQLELRVLAAASKDPGLIQAYKNDEDLHARVAATCWSKPIEEVAEAERRFAKTVSFGLVYGRSERSVAEELNLPMAEVDKLYEMYFDRFPGVYEFAEARKQEAKDNGFVRYPTGRIRYIVDAFSTEGERKAVNSPIQGSASEMVGDVLLATQSKFVSSGMNSRVWGWIHDSIELDLFPGELYIAYMMFRQAVEEDIHQIHEWFDVPCKGDFEIGSRWGTNCEVVSLEKLSNDEYKLIVDGKIPFVDELIEFMKRGYNVIETKDHEPTLVEPEEEIILRKSFPGDTGGNYKKETEIIYA